MKFSEFVLFVAASTAMGALSIYVVLPAFPAIAQELRLAQPVRIQAVITTYLIGFAASQLVFGPLSDRFGRKPILLVGLATFVVAALLSAATQSFATLLAARFLQGIGAGGPRVIGISLIRDRYTGARMGQAISYVTVAFSLFPVIAPLIGQALLTVARWRWLFGVLALAGAGLAAWAAVRLDETLPRERRRAISPQMIGDALALTFGSRVACACVFVMGLTLGNNYAYIGLSHQIFDGLFQAGSLYAPLFGLIALMLAAAALINTWLLRHWTVRRVILYALLASALVNLGHLVYASAHWLSLPMFVVFQGSSVFLFGLLMPNLHALAMEPVGDAAGTASALIGCISTTAGACLGFIVGQAFDGTMVPVAMAYLVLSTCALVAVRWATAVQRPPGA